MTRLEEELEALRRVYPGAELLELIGGGGAIRIPELRPTSTQWTPSALRGLLVLGDWPQSRPTLLVEEAIRQNGSPPANFSRQYLLGETWLGYSFSAAWDPNHPSLVGAVRTWMSRFNGTH
jgi:hypothetical protein